MRPFLPVLLLALFTSSFSTAMENGAPEIISERFTIASDVLSEERIFWVSLPDNYDDEVYALANYPVVYILDGIGYYSLATSAIQVISRTGNMPEAIVVSVDTSTHRTRDLTPTNTLLNWQNEVHYSPANPEEPAFASSGGADDFLKFLKAELIPYIDSSYRTAPHRTLIGHSFGGLAVVHSFLTQPGLFQGYVSIDGSLWYNKLSMVSEAKKLAKRTDLKGRFYFSLADHETTGPGDLTNMVVGNMKFTDILDKAPSPDLHIKLRVFDDETHGSVGLPSLYYGLRYVFEGHRLQYGWVKDVDTLVKHFQILSKRFGFVYLPPERLVDRVAHTVSFMPRENDQEILAFLELNLFNYPLSSHAHSSWNRVLRSS